MQINRSQVELSLFKFSEHTNWFISLCDWFVILLAKTNYFGVGVGAAAGAVVVIVVEAAAFTAVVVVLSTTDEFYCQLCWAEYRPLASISLCLYDFETKFSLAFPSIAMTTRIRLQFHLISVYLSAFNLFDIRMNHIAITSVQTAAENIRRWRCWIFKSNNGNKINISFSFN